ncbi:hypothetical protein ACTHGU_20735 [Chitinophagaceae bacterium MMS25-I14]
MALLDTIKSFFLPTEAESNAVKAKMRAFMQQATKGELHQGNTIVYGTHHTEGRNLTTRKYTFYNYAIAFGEQGGDFIILPIDPKLASCGWPVFVNSRTLKKAKKTLMGTTYQFSMNDGEDILFRVPGVNGKAGIFFGSLELAITQEAEAAAFKQFFAQWYS